MADRWLILADDLTGATDSGCAFAHHGHATLVTWGAASPAAGSSVIAYDVDSRRLAPDDAAARHRAAARRLLSPDRALYKKMDSTLRGQPAAEIAALCATLRELARPACGILAPANPSMGRTTREGRVFVHGQPLEQSETWRRDHSYANADLAGIIAAAGLGADKLPLQAIRGDAKKLRTAISEMTARADRGGDGSVIVADAETDEDLSRIVVAASGHAGFFIGTAGLAAALAARMPVGPRPPTEFPRRESGALIVVGSLASVSRAAARAVGLLDQVRHVNFTPATLLDPALDAQRVQQAQQIAAALDSSDDVLVEISITSTPDLALGPRLVRSLAECLWPAMTSASGLIVTGGETAAAVLSRCYVGGIHLVDEVEAGISLGFIDTQETRIPVITKPGAFGDAGSLVRSLQRLRVLRHGGTCK